MIPIRAAVGLVLMLVALIAAAGALLFLPLSFVHGLTSWHRQWEDTKSGLALFGASVLLSDAAGKLEPRLRRWVHH